LAIGILGWVGGWIVASCATGGKSLRGAVTA
jgi:hypothetical protein